VSRTGLEVADVFRHFGQAFRDQHGASLSRARWRAMAAIENCRTAALGGHVKRCGDCDHQRVAYNSCLMGKFSNGESRAALPSLMLLQDGFALHYRVIPKQGD
jgi:Transposase zinc-binding domain